MFIEIPKTVFPHIPTYLSSLRKHVLYQYPNRIDIVVLRLSEVDAVRSLNATERVIAQNGSAAFGNLSRGAGARPDSF